MDKPSKLFHKPMEVVWKRNHCNTYGSRLLPEMKEIDLEDSVKKKKKSSKSDSPSNVKNRNKESAHKRAKRSLFQGNKDKKVCKYSGATELNKNSTETQQIFRLKSSKVISKREKIIKGIDELNDHELKQHFAQNDKNSKTVDPPSLCGTPIGNNSPKATRDKYFPCTKTSHRSPEITSNRKRSLVNHNLPTKNVSDLDKVNLVSKNECIDNRHESCDYKIPPSKRSNRLSRMFQMLTSSKSPPIDSNRKKLERDLSTSLYEFKQKSSETDRNSKVVEPSSCRSTHNTSIIKSSSVIQDSLIPNTTKLSSSPEIMSNRKRSVKTNSLDRIHDKPNATLTNLNKNHRKSCDDYVINPRKRSHRIHESCQVLSLSKSPSIVPIEKKMKTDEDTFLPGSKRGLFYTLDGVKPIELKPSTLTSLTAKISNTEQDEQIMNCINNGFRKSKSPEMMSNRKRNLLNTSVKKTNVPESNLDSNKNHYQPIDHPHAHARNNLPEAALQIVSNWKNIKMDGDKTYSKSKESLFQTLDSERANELIRSPLVSFRKSPEIMSNRKRFSLNKNVDKMDVSEFNLDTNKNHCQPTDHAHANMTKSLPKALPEFSCPKNPQIVSNRKNIKINEDTFLKSKKSLFQTMNSVKATELKPSTLTSLTVEPSNTEQSKKIINSMNNDFCKSKSPEIVSNRKRYLVNNDVDEMDMYEFNLDANKNHCKPMDHIIPNVRKSLPKTPLEVSSSKKAQIVSNRKNIKINEDKCLKSKRSLLQILDSVKDSKSKLSPLESLTEGKQGKQKMNDVNNGLCKSKSPEIMSNRKCYSSNNDVNKMNLSEFNLDTNKNHDQPNDCINAYAEKIWPKAPMEFPSLKNPQIVSNRKNIKKEEDTFPKSKRCLFQTLESVPAIGILPSHLNPNTLIVKPHKTAQDQTMFIPPVTTNEKKTSENDKPCSKKLPLKSNLVITESEDIIESSEVIDVLLNKPKFKRNKIQRCKVSKIKKHVDDDNQTNSLKLYASNKNKINLQKDKLSKITKLEENYNNGLCDEFDSDSSDIINTEKEFKFPDAELNNRTIEKNAKQPSALLEKYQHSTVTDIYGIQERHSGINLNQTLNSSFKELVKNDIIKDQTLKLPKSIYFNCNQDKKCVSFNLQSSEILEIPATPEKITANNADDKFDNEIEPVIEGFSETPSKYYVPQIEVDQSPNSPHKKKCHALIQSVHSPQNEEDTTLLNLFEPIASPSQTFMVSQESPGLPFQVCTVVLFKYNFKD